MPANDPLAYLPGPFGEWDDFPLPEPQFGGAPDMAGMLSGEGMVNAPAPQFPAPESDWKNRLAMALSGMQSPGAHGRSGDVFGANLLHGLAQGFAQPRMQEMSRTEQLNERMRQQQQRSNEMAIQATREAQKERRERLFQSSRDSATAKREEAKAAAEKVLAPAWFAKYAGVAPGTRVKIDDVLKARADMFEQGKPVKPEKPEKPDYGAMGAMTGRIQSDPDVSGFVTVRDAYTTGKDAANRNNSAGDIILMRMIAKATDPTTGVREEEFRTFQGAQGVLGRLGVRLTTNMWGGGQLTPEGRKQLKGVLDDIYSRKASAYQRRRGFYERQARSIGVDPSLVLEDLTPTESVGAGGAKPNPADFWRQ